MKIFFSKCIVTALVLLCGCAAGQPPQSFNNDPLAQVTVVDEDGLFAADRHGHKLAFARGGLHLLDLDSGATQKLSPDNPVALSWRRDDARLAVAFPVADYETRLALYSAQGSLLNEVLLPVVLSQLVWSAGGDLLVTGFALKNYSFGSGLRQSLFQLNGAEVVETVLSDTTLKPATAKLLASSMHSAQPVAFSPYGDELVYLHLHDPPQFPPYLELRYHNWPAAMGRLLQKLPLQMLQLDWGELGDSLTVRTTHGAQTFELWPTAEAGETPRASMDYRFVDGRLSAGQELLADWGAKARLQILPDGRFLLAVRNRLYRGNGLQAESHEDYSERRWLLRRWRFEGLITPAEYQQLLRKEKP